MESIDIDETRVVSQPVGGIHNDVVAELSRETYTRNVIKDENVIATDVEHGELSEMGNT